MLVLSRKLNESIVINYDIVVTVLGVKGDTCDWASKPPEKSRSIARKCTRKCRTRRI